MGRASVFSVLVLSACVGDSGSSRSCALEDVIERRTGGAALRACSPPTTSDADLRIAHDCALAAATAREPFLVQWELQGIDSLIAQAYVGMTIGGTWTLFSFLENSDPTGGNAPSHPTTSTATCTSLADLGDCADLRNTLCVQCAMQSQVDSCRTPLEE